MPSGEVAICDSVSRIAEIQALASVHSLDRSSTLVAKAEGKDAEQSCQKWQGVSPALPRQFGNVESNSGNNEWQRTARYW